MRAWSEVDDVDVADFRRVMQHWVGTTDSATVNPLHALERGELTAAEFERDLALRLRTRSGDPVAADGLLLRMFAGFRHAQPMVEVVRRAKAGGLRTALLSNSWGLDYDRAGWDELFDAVVISGEVGLRKPEPEIYRRTAAALGVEPSQCVFVDDLPGNVAGAVAVGMVGVRHRTVEETVAELDALFGMSLLPWTGGMRAWSGHDRTALRARRL